MYFMQKGQKCKDLRWSRHECSRSNKKAPVAKAGTWQERQAERQMGYTGSSFIWHCEGPDFDFEMWEQWKVLDREVISPDFGIHRLPLTAVLEIAWRETRLKAGKPVRRLLQLFGQGRVWLGPWAGRGWEIASSFADELDEPKMPSAFRPKARGI